MKKNLSIRDLAKNMNLTTRALRYYEELGLIKSIQEGRGNRLYEKEEISKIIYLNELKNRGFSLKEIEVLLGNRCCNQKKDFLENRVKDNIAMIEFLEWQNKKIQDEMNIIEKLDISNIKIEIEKLKPFKYFSMEEKNSIYSDPDVEKIWNSKNFDDRKDKIYSINFMDALSNKKEYTKTLYPNPNGDLEFQGGLYLIAYSREGVSKQNIIFNSMKEYAEKHNLKIDDILYVENKFRIFCKREQKAVVITKNFIKIKK